MPHRVHYSRRLAILVNELSVLCGWSFLTAGLMVWKSSTWPFMVHCATSACFDGYCRPKFLRSTSVCNALEFFTFTHCINSHFAFLLTVIWCVIGRRRVFRRSSCMWWTLSAAVARSLSCPTCCMHAVFSTGWNCHSSLPWIRFCSIFHTVFVLFIRASQNIVNTISCRVFDTFSSNLHQWYIMGQRWTLHNLGSKGQRSRSQWNKVFLKQHFLGLLKS